MSTIGMVLKNGVNNGQTLVSTFFIHKVLCLLFPEINWKLKDSLNTDQCDIMVSSPHNDIPKEYIENSFIIFDSSEPGNWSEKFEMDLMILSSGKHDTKVPSIVIPWGSVSFAARNVTASKLIEKKTDLTVNKNFCAFMNSNSNSSIYEGVRIREQFFDELSKYKPVHGLGSSKHNKDLPSKFQIKTHPNNIPKFFDDNTEIYKEYKFIISMENSNYPFYITEKIIDVFLSGSIPIYWGNETIFNFFNKDAFIYLPYFNSMEDCIEYIKKIDSDDELYFKIINENAFVNNVIPDEFSWSAKPTEKFYNSFKEKLLSSSKFLKIINKP